jgi:hypothetical protein
MHLPKGIILFILAAALLMVGCDDDDPTCPEPEGTPTPTLANIWPHADGTSWLYDLTVASYEPYPALEDTVPLPSMDELYALLAAPVTEDLLNHEEGLYRLQFDGEITTDTGITGQDLVETYYAPLDGLNGADKGAEAADPLLSFLYQTRPDLRDNIIAHVGPEKEFLDESGTIFFLSAYVFSAEESGIYGYGDVTTGPAWTYLEGDLEPGSSWSLQLVPGVADDIWLYGQVRSVGDWTEGDRTWNNAVECFYLVDLGLQAQTTEGGDLLGVYQSYMIGVTVFVPGVGPVACHERHVLAPFDDNLGEAEDGGIFEFRCLLVP